MPVEPAEPATDTAAAAERPSRRAALRWGTGLGLAVAGAGPALAGCSSAHARGSAAGASAPSSADGTPGAGPGGAASTRGTAAAAASGPSTADWNALARELPSGALVRPGDRRYSSASHLFQPQFDGIHPSGVAYVRSTHDVAACIGFARRFRLPIAARCGGHSYAGWSGSTGLVVDVSALNGISARSGEAVIGAGARLIDVYTGLAAHGATIPAGSCPTVGVTGLTLGGGVGVTGRAYGLTCDSLTSAEIVTADGRVRTASASAEPDLFWALRGGGGGNFGIVTSLGFRTHPAESCSYAFLNWPWSRAAAVVEGWQRWAPSAPDALWANLHLACSEKGVLSVSVGANLLGGSTTELENHLTSLVRDVGAEPSSRVVNSRPYLATMQVMGGVLGWSEAQAHLPGGLPGQNPAGRVVRQSYAARSDVFTRTLPTAGAKALAAAVERYARSGAVAAGGSAAVAFDVLGGAIGRVRAQDTAFVHRNGLFIAQYIANYPSRLNGSVVSRSHAWLDGTWSAMRPYASGQAYQNYLDPRLAKWRQAYYGANAARLATVKHQYDPGRLFTFPQAI
ncbi:FAD-dependent oxidoreductase [Phaeacidiphilus oryzae]|uniref:FAD-dependent oxidoreductase n=1 Tax=Phaeacidiphilus oryzae TaxID=348818 RepID=UPI000A01EEDC|nr:FAD-dependent oxidoreductase [Phaeacidiphilus oryzae]